MLRDGCGYLHFHVADAGTVLVVWEQDGNSNAVIGTLYS